MTLIPFPDLGVFHFQPGEIINGQTFNYVNTVQDEQFYCLYVSLFTSKIKAEGFNRGDPFVIPKITYYQTIYSEGNEPFTKFYTDPTFYQQFIGVPGRFTVFQHVPERNDALGGYLEGRLNGNFHINDRIDFNPYGIISVSFHDRTEPVNNPQTKREIIRGQTLSGWNNAQIGLRFRFSYSMEAGLGRAPARPIPA